MYLERDMFPRDYELREELKPLPNILIPGGSSIIGPDGAFIVEPVMNKEELIVAAIDPLRAQEENITLDVSGHYSRPDIFDLTVRRHRK
jgi:nitrilase